MVLSKNHQIFYDDPFSTTIGKQQSNAKVNELFEIGQTLSLPILFLNYNEVPIQQIGRCVFQYILLANCVKRYDKYTATINSHQTKYS